ncbi:MAG TPA: hypothetical protein PKB03_09630, partial [Baekduia sp.]|nr:hypothetical protein [Baekduia sp.]
MRFVDLLRATVMFCGAAATTMVVVTVLAAASEGGDPGGMAATVWWTACLLVGLLLSRRRDTNPAIGRLLADSKAATQMPELRVASTLINRLWPIVVGAVATPVGPQVPALVGGVTMIWALSWRRQAQAVTAIEERDGVTFFVVRTSPFRSIKLERIPGFRREHIAGR